MAKEMQNVFDGRLRKKRIGIVEKKFGFVLRSLHVQTIEKRKAISHSGANFLPALADLVTALP